VSIYKPDHPNSNARGMIRVNRYVMAERLGRPLLPTETVHHKNGNRADNRIENLELRVGHHGPGQTVGDRIEDAINCLRVYAPHLLA
jgi:hypothetical protein